ncbi:2OG-Fe(II) oxygenase superfamily protein [Schizosaccharomyces cryophilus OY26]|uniref:2OG-Fe(II) oxygenase superfamily protein n=1 Tax=Schizosaccharomyces cryophilus (strain OY26 / ATCC MYA-4695 / CBS 11777 / NBRC 106824 / NRRL Y48691) TaxID=653667 RepID=S9X9R9_SCHCR|nr:2OG-Fe(II) oxygenase superfamily protein [Schizosaccharomyces cryophilus OY26]EPY53892.1 2OG-Fe(II) oxygenase superfamily protein [Schizosaccharomyces cryophilus OY26]
MKSIELPCIDLSEENTKLLATLVVDACKEWGFFTLKNHGIKLDDVQVLFKKSDDFFNLPTEEKEKYVYQVNASPSGYSRHTSERSYPDDSNTKPVREFYDIARFPNPDLETISPAFRERLPELKMFQKQCHDLSLRILELIALAFELPQDFYSKCHSSTEDFVRFIKYVVPEGKEHREDDVDTDSHFDYGTISLLFQREYGCLQIQPPKSHATVDWVRVSVDKEVISVNVADMLHFWTGGRVKSSIHQIRIEPHTRERQLIAYFATPDLDCPLNRISDKEDGKNTKTITAREYKEKRSQRPS